MPRRKKSKQKQQVNSGLGHALINSRASRPNGGQPHGRTKRRTKPIQPIDPSGSGSAFRSHSQKTNVASSRALKSTTQVTDIAAFMDRVQDEQLLAAQQEVVTIIEPQRANASEREHVLHQQLHRSEMFEYSKMPIPRRPIWDEETTPEELGEAEEAMFLLWRRSLAVTAEKHKIRAMTPYERNLEVWRQLWRVIERSDVVVVIVDARNPLAFLPKDLLDYVGELGERQNKAKSVLVVMNKSDFLTAYQRKIWRQYFDEIGIDIVFFSALYEQLRQEILSKSHREKLSEIEINQIMTNMTDSIGADDDEKIDDSSHNVNIRVLGVPELFGKFQSYKSEDASLSKITIGFVGYPNVGKSSLINALVGAKKVAVAATPGKTKHFQTLEIDSENLILCDCPGLVFPTMLASKSDLVLNGVLSIDNLTDFIAPLRLACHRLPIGTLNKIYGLGLNVYRDDYIIKQSQLTSPDDSLLDDALAQQQLEEYLQNLVTVFDVVDTFCERRQLKLKGGSLNRNEAARIMLKDFIRGKLLYCHPPPHVDLFGRYEFVAQQIYQSRQWDVVPESVENSELEIVVEVDEEGSVGDEEDDENVLSMEASENASSSGVFDLSALQEVSNEDFETGLNHPMDSAAYNPDGKMGSSKRKDMMKKRTFVKQKRRKMKHNRAFRRDAENFAHGSNAMISSSVPGVRGVNAGKEV